MRLTEGQLRERGIFRSVEEMVEEAREMVALSVAEMPVGRVSDEPGRDFTEEESGVLVRGGLDPSRPSGGRRLARTLARYAALRATALTESEAASLLGVSESRVRQRVAQGTLYGVRVGRGRRLPRFQFAGGGPVPSVGAVLKELRQGVHPISVENWFTLPNPDLYLDEDEEEPVSPREWLISGGSPEPLKPLAREL